jgi:hypothetical protein
VDTHFALGLKERDKRTKIFGKEGQITGKAIIELVGTSVLLKD